MCGPVAVAAFKVAVPPWSLISSARIWAANRSAGFPEPMAILTGADNTIWRPESFHSLTGGSGEGPAIAAAAQQENAMVMPARNRARPIRDPSFRLVAWL